MNKVKVTAVDEEKGGKVINGQIVGATKTITKYEVEGRLFDSREEANLIEIGHELNANIFDALGLNLFANRTLTPNSIVGLIRDNAVGLKKVLQSPRYWPLFKDQEQEIPQEKIDGEANMDFSGVRKDNLEVLMEKRASA